MFYVRPEMIVERDSASLDNGIHDTVCAAVIFPLSSYAAFLLWQEKEPHSF